ncbi:MAG TPA: AAA family ATPase [Polyangiaceae bacterium]|nr:AAA family ATPase [Polyangiaceae bacterium]
MYRSGTRYRNGAKTVRLWYWRSMAIYLSGCSKGGVGKSTLAVNIAAHLSLSGRRVGVVDGDNQQHANAWCVARLRAGGTLPTIHGHVLTGSIAEPLRTLAPEYGDIVVDAGGHDSREMRSAMRVADAIIMPFAASHFDLFAVEKMAELVEAAREYNPKLFALAFVNKAETNWVRSKTAHAALEFIASFPAMQRAETIVHLRIAPFTDSIEGGRSVFELGRGGQKAAEEVAALFEEVQRGVSNA